MSKKWCSVRTMLAVLTALACTCDAAGAGKPVQVFDPVNLRSTVQTEFSLKFEWAAGSTSIVGYKVAYAVSPTVPALSSAISVGNVTSYWLPDIAPSTSYNFKVWALDKKGKTSPGVMVTGTTSALPTDYLSYARHDGHTLSHATYDPVNDRVYATGMPGWNLTARDPLDLNALAEGWPEANDGIVTTHPYYPSLQYDYSIAVTTDSSGNIYLGGRGPLEDPNKTGFRIEKVDPNGNVLWTAYGPETYECTEVFIHEEQVDGQSVEFLYAMGFYVFESIASAQPIILVKLDPETKDEVFSVSLGAPADTAGGNFQNMAIGSDGVYLTWQDVAIAQGVISKYDFNGVWQVEARSGSAIPQCVTTGYWGGQERVWVAFPNLIRRYDTNLSEALPAEVGLGCHMVEPIPSATDYCRSMHVESGDNGNAWLYACGKTWVMNGGDAFILRFGMTANATSLDTFHVFDWGPSDSFSSVFLGDGPEVFVSGPAGRDPQQFTVLFKFFDP